MKISISLVLLFVIKGLCSITLMAQDQMLIRQSVIPETGEHRAIHFGLMLPPSYEANDRYYPVIYYLHGLNGHYSDWEAQMVAEFYAELFREGEIPEFILVFPDGGEGFWGDHYDRDPLLEKELVDFLFPYIDQLYRVNTENRTIMGWSAGGAGAMAIFSKHPGLFKAIISLDGSIITWEEFVYFQGEKPDIVNNSEYYYEHFSPTEWVVRNSTLIKEKQDTAIFLSAAFFADSHQNFLKILNDQGIPFIYKELGCNHEFACVFRGIRNDLLSFLSMILD